MKYTALITVVLSITGCQPSAKLNLTTPDTTTVRLRSQSAHYDVRPDGRTVVVINVPGDPDTIPLSVYLSWPTGDGTFVYGSDGHLDGFVVMFEGGDWTHHALASASLDTAPFWHDRKGQFDAVCADGTLIDGSFVARMSSRYVREFENRFNR